MKTRALIVSLAVIAGGCTTTVKPPPEITLDEPVKATALPEPPKPVSVVALPEPLPLPGQLKPLEVTQAPVPDAPDPRARVAKANDDARVAPTREGYLNAIQVWPYSEGALYQVYASPGRVTDIMLQEGEELISVSAGDTVRWIVGDTTSASGAAQRVHVLVKPVRANLKTNLVVTTSRRIYLLELTATEQTWMASASWEYPRDRLTALKNQAQRADTAAPVAQGIALERLAFRYDITGDTPSWRPLRAFDDGERVYIQFPAAVAQGELPPLFVVGVSGKAELVNYRYHAPYYIVDRLFGAAELRLGGDQAQIVRISRTDGIEAAEWIVSTPKESPDILALRAPPRPVTRLNRRTLAIVVGVLAATVLGATIWSLQSQRKGLADAPVELHNVDRIAHAEGLEQLPDDYSKVARPARTPPMLGPPLPGDLGGALLRAERPATDSLAGSPTLRADPAADAARVERINRQREAEEAAKASLFFRASARKDVPSSTSSASGPLVSPATPITLPTTGNGPASNDKPGSQEPQQRKKAFLDRSSVSTTLSTHELQLPASPYQVMAGTIIPAALITGINSDLPGQVMASVTENVYDTATGRHLLIPQGSRLLGQYDSQVAFGQRRVLLVWTRLMLPDASSIVLDRLPGVDATGFAGLADEVDWRWQQLLAGAALSTLIGVGAELAAPDRSNGQSQVIVATRQSVQDSVNQVGQELTGRSLNVQPTLTIRPGFPVRVIVSRDLVLRPYQPLFFERSSPLEASTNCSGTCVGSVATAMWAP